MLLAAFLQPCAAATPFIGAGERHGIALGADGRVRTWGDDSGGVLGIGRALSSRLPAAVAGATGIIAVSAGESHVLALRQDRTVIAWGSNSNGQIGDGTTTQRSTPVAVTGLANVLQVSAGGGYSMARTADGRVWEWGETPVPTRVEGLDDVVEISAGWRFVLARRSDGSVWAWGANDFGQLGDGTRGEPYVRYPTPRRVSGLTGVTRISAGGDHALALRADGTVWAWGANGRGEAGDGTTADRLLPVQVAGLSAITTIAAGNGHSIVIRDDGTALGWGQNGYAELGDGTYTDRPMPVPLPELNGALAISTGFLHSVALVSGGTFVAWGNNERGQLGDPGLIQPLKPVPVSGLAGFSAVSVGDLFTVALKNDGTVWTWGDNAFGQLGNNAFIFRSTPSAVDLAGVEKIASGGFHALALKADGSVFAWGDSRASQIGDGASVNRSAPVPVSGLGSASGVRDIAAGAIHSLALEAAGTVLSWGDNYSSQLGPREGSDTSVPSRIAGLADVTAIAAGGGHSVALKRDGTVWTWGHNNRGQLGDGTRGALYQGRLVPTAVAGVSGVRAISAGGGHTVVLKTDGTLWAWGGNGSGQLGDGTNEDRLTPVRVASGLADVTAISAGDSHTLALTGDGNVWAWGANWNYRLGDGSGADRASPVRVAGLGGVVAISASGHSVALKGDGSVWSWGPNGSGQLGDGTLIDRETAVVALREGGAGSIAGNDWFLDLDPAVASVIPTDKVPVFLVVAAPSASDITASLRFRAADVGTTGSVYVFAVAPATIVKGGSSAKAMRVGYAKGPAAKADAPVACVLAQLSQAGQMIAVTSGQLQAYLTGVLSAQGASVSILGGVPIVNVAGSTFFVGYGTSGGSMINGGVNRGALTVPGSLACQPGPPQTGWWWNPLEDGRGFSLEVRGANLFFAAFLYDISGRSTWYVSTGPVSLEGSYYSGDLLSARGGQTLAGAYPGFPALSSVGAVTMTFHNANSGTLVWPGGTVPIQRFNIVPNGLNLPPVAGQPESGWWWNEQEAGRGFFLEWQGGNLDIAGYMYDDAGNSVWYLTTGPISGTPAARSFSGNWWSFGEGQTLTGAWKPNRQLSSNVAPVTIQFSGPDTAIITLPGGRTSNLRRHRF